MQPPATLAPDEPATPPDHKQLPDKDGKFVTNSQEHAQSGLLTDSVLPHLRKLCPDGQFCIGSDNGIYWRFTQPPLSGCKAPDWFVVIGVPPMLNGEVRRSYVLWQEGVRPLLLIEYVSGDGSEEHDTTPQTGKFWVYEQGIAAPYYAIFDEKVPSLEVFQLVAGRYQPLPANAQGRFSIPQLGVDLGLWEGTYHEMNPTWVRFWDTATGKLIPSPHELTAEAQQRAEESEGLLEDTRVLLNEEAERADAAEQRADAAEELLETERNQTRKLAEKLRALGIDPGA